MLNILLLSTIYPLHNKVNKGTPVCHYFTREWVEMGYNVRVIHIQAVYPHLFYWLAKLNAKKIAAKTGAVVYTERLGHEESYVMDNVPVKRIPVFKPIPHGKFSSRSVRIAVKSIVNDCLKDKFMPDIVIGHFPNPQIQILSLLKKVFPSTKTCIVMHGEIKIMMDVYGKKLQILMKDIDMWGFRNKNVQDSFEMAVGKVDKSFICYSGIPSQFVTSENKHDFSTPVRNFIYVGLMIERKYPEKVIEALNEVYDKKDFHLTYIGGGQQIAVVNEKVKAYGFEEQVSILGRIPREQIIEEYDKADCMVMISKGEAYGLVYLEAMSRGCITIASRNEGFDGVIIDGENGFLCKAGDSEELASIIRRINSMTPEERQQISDNAIETAKRLTDEKAAKLYIDNVRARM